VDVDQQNQISVGRNRRARKQLYVPQVRPEILDNYLVLPYHVLYDDPNLAARNIGDHQTVIAVDWISRFESQLTVNAHNFRDCVTHLGEKFAAHFLDIVSPQAPNLFDKRQREGEHVFTATNKQRLRNDQSEWYLQREPRAATLLRLDVNLAVQCAQI